MGIRSLTRTIKSNSPDSISHENLFKLSGKRVAVDASLIIYQQLFNTPGRGLFKNSKGNVTNHITGVFYKIMNYISINVELIFIFDGKPPDNKYECIQRRKDKSMKAKELSEMATTQEEKDKYDKASIRLTKFMVDEIKKLLTLMGVSYIHPDGEGEAYASELCRMGYVDYVLTEDMDAMAYGCPHMIRKCIDKSIKRKDIVSIISYDMLISDLGISHDAFLNFCILCGCDYCPIIPKVGPVTALKLVRQYDNIDDILENLNNMEIPDGYIDMFHNAKKNFLLFRDKIKLEDIEIVSSEENISELREFLMDEVEMNEKRVQNALKKFHNKYK